jgi:hypothetical protein
MTSVSWPEFKEAVHRTTGDPMAICKHCNQQFQHPQLGTAVTTSLSRHLKSCGGFKKLQTSGASIDLEFFEKPKSRVPEVLTVSFVNDQILKFFISGNISFNQADNPEFQVLMSLIRVDGHMYTSQGRKAVRNNLTEWAILSKEELRGALARNDSKVSLVLDCWISRNRHAFLGMIFFIITN